MVNIDLKLDTWKNKLLDMGKRNRLLNYRDTRRSNLRIIVPGIYDLWDSFVVNEQPLKFPRVDEDENQQLSLEENQLPATDPNSVQTNQSPKEQQRTLRNLRSKAKAFMEEQGVNVLYLTFGFLRWTEAEHSHVQFDAPLILVPASLSLKSITSPFVLSLHEDEIIVNPTLAYKLDNDFGIKLPEFSIENSLADYFKSIRQVTSVNRWEVIPEVGLALLSFLKINMYRDLENHREAILDNPVVRSLSGDVTAVDHDLSVIDNFDHDGKSTPEQTFQVVDADASQQDAILCAKRGHSFVLQGPPGTGKSQTITNIIAECLADGKKVLFVSEKMAALEVVHKRLKEAGLDEFCLILHSHKANKKDTLAQLSSVLDLASQKATLSDDAYSQLSKLVDRRQQLNDYVNAVHQIVEPLHKSIYAVNGRIAELQEYEDLIFPIPDVRHVTPKLYQDYIRLLDGLCSTAQQMHGDFRQNPWRWTTIPHVNNELRHDIWALQTKGIPSKLERLSSLCDIISEKYRLGSVNSCAALPKLVKILSLAANPNKVPAGWIIDGDIPFLFDFAEDSEKLQSKALQLLERIEQAKSQNAKFSDTIRNHHAFSSALEIEPLQEHLHNLICGNPYYSTWDQVEDTGTIHEQLELLRDNIHTWNELRQQLSDSFDNEIFTLDCVPIKNRFSTQYTSIFVSILLQYERDLGEVCAHLRDPKSQHSNSEILHLLGKAKKFVELKSWVNSSKEIAEYEAVTKFIFSSYEKEIDDIDYNAMFLRFRTSCQSALKIFNSQYRTDKATIGGLRKNIDTKISDTDVLDILGKLRRRAELKQWMSESAEYTQYASIKKELDDTFDEGIFSIDYAEIHSRFSVEYTEDFSAVRKQYISDMKALQGMCTREDTLDPSTVSEYLEKLHCVQQIESWLETNSTTFLSLFCDLYQKENSDVESIKSELNMYQSVKDLSILVDSLYDIRAIQESQDDQAKTQFEFLYTGISTDWTHIWDCLTWANDFKWSLCNIADHQFFVEAVCKKDDTWQEIKTISAEISEIYQDILPSVEWFIALFNAEESSKLSSARLDVLSERITSCLNDVSSLEDWIDFRRALTNCINAGLTEYTSLVFDEGIAPASIVPVFQKRFFRLWLDSVLPEFPAVANFRRKTQEAIIQEFDQLDKLQFAIARSRIRSELINGLPSLDHFTSGVDEISVLRRELKKQRRIMPIRRLFRTIPNLILTLKPCLMMSPLSVSLFLEADSFMFDTVIFDEASQVCTENAIGAILRGKQVIIAGDSKQLPPTNFFSAAVSDSDFDADTEDEEEYDDSSAYESILDEAALLPERTLLWHYRSRHEHLIAFSNAKIYKGNLITFPSNVDRAPNLGVEYTYVPTGYYDRGGRKGNVIEAEKVVDLIFEHFRQFPNRSLGVIAFGEVQQMAIDTVLRKRRMENQRYEPFFDEDKPEAFFVKSLENVQGDERDTIIFSIGYAKDAAGVMRMNFGPLSKMGGERRLNVAITRAKYNVKLVGSLLPTDINTDRISADGPKLLRGYIDFAMNGPTVLQNEITESDCVEHDSPFEEAVYKFLDRKGYKLATQVGCSGYRIDMAVKHPTLSGRYVLGIECDGAAYHSARTARERDRLRQDVLESMGWKIYRIWSTDWIKDPITEGQRLIEAVDTAISSYVEDTPAISLRQDAVDHLETDPFMTVEAKQVSVEDIANPYGFDVPVTTDFSTLSQGRNGFPKLTECIELLVRNEYPIHYELICQKLSPLLGREKATSVVRNEVNRALRSLSDRIVRKGDFFYPAVYTKIPARQANGRNIKHISTDELAAAMLRVLSRCVGTTRTALIDETTRALGFNRRGANIAKAMGEAFEQLIIDGKICEKEEKLSMNLSQKSEA